MLWDAVCQWNGLLSLYPDLVLREKLPLLELVLLAAVPLAALGSGGLCAGCLRVGQACLASRVRTKQRQCLWKVLSPASAQFDRSHSLEGSISWWFWDVRTGVNEEIVALSPWPGCCFVQWTCEQTPKLWHLLCLALLAGMWPGTWQDLGDTKPWALARGGRGKWDYSWDEPRAHSCPSWDTCQPSKINPHKPLFSDQRMKWLKLDKACVGDRLHC